MTSVWIILRKQIAVSFLAAFFILALADAGFSQPGPQTITKTFGGTVTYNGQPQAGATILINTCTGVDLQNPCYQKNTGAVATDSNGYFSFQATFLCNDNWMAWGLQPL